MTLQKYNSPSFVSTVQNAKGSLPNIGANTIGPDLVEWEKFKLLRQSHNSSGSVFSKPIPVFTYQGSANVFPKSFVLDTSGDVHLIGQANVVIKITNSTKTISTYSLFGNFGTNYPWYSGAVLNSIGEIHFVPLYASVGQKISPAGVVSTYSIIHSSVNGAYRGGTVAPNGDVHFIPSGTALVGQKVSLAGTVSTYSIVRTGATISQSVGYNGGVLAPDGSIHFVPRYATIGQKVSSSGVVSTYSLIATSGSFGHDGASNAWSGGGVLDSDGNIHFLPTLVNSTNASNNQVWVEKVSIAGIVSTYSFTSPYPSGNTGTIRSSFIDSSDNIHLIVGYSYGEENRGIKLKNGVATSYPLVFGNTSFTNVVGGCLPSGEILIAGINSNGNTAIQIYKTTEINPLSGNILKSPFYNNRSSG